uniref:DNA polymerase III delta N-terminal domain-containing protein n=1 Tax=viral metagenome TaxID=1070528 RepID=A0A6C0F5G0_9ZZZZ|tara:strand:+ start:1011 stop:1862 length:852 start_codon:yes stop_codon:yes gene_type:complete
MINKLFKISSNFKDMLLHERYKNVLIDEQISILRKLENHIIIIGPENSGKKTILKCAFPNHIIVHIDEINNSFLKKLMQSVVFTKQVYLIIIGCQSENHGKELSSLIDKYGQYLVFLICTRNWNSIGVGISSRCTIWFLKQPSFQAKVNLLSKITQLDDNTIQKIANKYALISEILLAADLAKFTGNIELCYWEPVLSDLLKNIKHISFAQIRQKSLKLLMLMATPTEIIKKTLDYYTSINSKHICHIALYGGLYDYRSKLGNKNLYHIEAFLFKIKDLLMYG